MPFMTDLLRSIQQSNVFGQPAPQPTPQGNYQQPVGQDLFATPVVERPPVDDFFGNSPFDVPNNQPTFGRNESLDAFVQHARNSPYWERPSGWRTLGTALYSGMRTAPDKVSETIGPDGRVTKRIDHGGQNPLSAEEIDYYLNLPNRRRLDDWKLKGSSLKEAAAGEERRLNNESLNQSRMALNRYREGNLEVARERENRMATTDAGRAELARLKYQLEVWKTQNPKGVVRAIPGGNVVVINPQDGSVIDTKVPSGLMTQEELRRLMGQQAIDQINTRGLIGDSQIATRHANDMERDAANQQFRYSFDDYQTQNDIKAGEARNPANKPLLPTQEKQRIANKVGMLLTMYPEWKQWLSIDPNTGQPVIAPPSSGAWYSRGPSKELHDNIVAAVFGSDNPQIPNQAPNQSTTPPPPPASMNRPGRKWRHDGRIWQYSDDGRSWTSVGGGR